MFFEYAVDPSVLSDWNAVRYFLDAFAPSKGRFIARYPRAWKRLVWNNVAGRPDREKKQIEVRLGSLKDRCFAPRSGAPYDSARPWLENAVGENARAPFRAIVAAAGAAGNVLDATSLDETVDLWRVESGALVPRDEASFVDVLRLLLQVSKRIAIVDPYFRPDKRSSVRVLAALCEAAGPSKVIEVHARLGEERDPAHEYFKATCESHLVRELADGARVTIHAWSQRSGGPRLHNRYLLTDVAGVQFGDAVEGGKAGEQDHLSILPETSRAELWQQYVEPAQSFSPVGEVIALDGTAVGPRR
ncbi:MAG: hypothetical protein KC464_27030 [Myxococcales bacterium]|nr:hypothetical protein [Myxococcales bacterium]